MEVTSQSLMPGQIELLNRSFQVRDGNSFLDDFPVWTSPHIQQYCYKEGELTIATSSLRLAELKTGPTTGLPIAMIGGVATHVEHRGKGLASKLVECATRAAKDQGAALCVLWGSETEFYRRLGYEWMGRQVRIPLANLALEKKIGDQGQLPTLEQGWHLSLIRSLVARNTGVRLTYSDHEWISNHKNVKWFWIGNPLQPDAYCAFEKGIDLGNTIHEWGGKTQAHLNQLLYLVQAQHPEALLLSHPIEIVKRGWSMTGQKLEPEPLCMGHIFKEAEIVKQLGSFWRGDSQFWFWGLDGC